jgi:hypothetical protein
VSTFTDKLNNQLAADEFTASQQRSVRRRLRPLA